MVSPVSFKLCDMHRFLRFLRKCPKLWRCADSAVTNSAITDSGFLSQSSLNGSSTSPTSKINGASNSNGGSSGSLHKLPGLTGAEKVNLLNRYLSP